MPGSSPTAGAPKKPSTLAIDRGRIVRHIKPLLGERLVQDANAADVEAFFHAVRRGETAATVPSGKKRGLARVTGGVVTASRTVDLLGSIFSYAVRGQLRPDNPVTGFARPTGRRRDRALSPADYGELGKALDALEAEGANPVAIAAVRALALTGCRRGEILALRCDQIDAHRQVLRLSETKAGQQLRPIGKAALEALEAAQRDFAAQRGSLAYLFPADRGSGPLVGVKLFKAAVARAKLVEVTLHTLRHSFASTALDLGFSELTIAGLLGHRAGSVIARYAHHVDRALVAAAERVAERIKRAMAGDELPTVVALPLRRA